MARKQPVLTVSKKRAFQEDEELEEDEESAAFIEVKPQAKKSKENPKEEEKAVLQSNLASFLGIQKNPASKFQGQAKYEDFPSEQLSIWNWNINGINAVIERGDIQDFIKKIDPTILCLNEIKVDYEKLDKMGYYKHIGSDYEQYWNCCKVKKGYAGTAIFTKVKPISVTYDLGMPKHDGEGRVITAEFKEFVLVSTYVPNSGDGLKRLKYRVDEWDKDF